MNIPGFGVLCTWLPHVTYVGQSGTGQLILLDDFDSYPHALYYVYVNDQSIKEIRSLAAVRVDYV